MGAVDTTDYEKISLRNAPTDIIFDNTLISYPDSKVKHIDVDLTSSQRTYRIDV